MKQNLSLITGANSGIGLALTKKIIMSGGTVIALIRSSFPPDEPLIEQAIKTGKILIYQVDLSDFRSLKNALMAIKQQQRNIDLLFSNAGVSTETLQFSPQGRELQFEVNTVVPYILTRELKECLSEYGSRTIIHTSSNALMYVKRFQVEELDQPRRFQKLFGPYATSKLALSLWTRQIASQLKKEGIKIASVDPGGNQSKMTASSSMPLVLRMIAKLTFPPASQGAQRLDEIAHRLSLEQSGHFFLKGRVSSLPFGEQGKALLDKLDSIFTREYLPLIAKTTTHDCLKSTDH